MFFGCFFFKEVFLQSTSKISIIFLQISLMSKEKITSTTKENAYLTVNGPNGHMPEDSARVHGDIHKWWCIMMTERVHILLFEAFITYGFHICADTSSCSVWNNVISNSHSIAPSFLLKLEISCRMINRCRDFLVGVAVLSCVVALSSCISLTSWTL